MKISDDSLEFLTELLETPSPSGFEIDAQLQSPRHVLVPMKLPLMRELHFCCCHCNGIQLRNRNEREP